MSTHPHGPSHTNVVTRSGKILSVLLVLFLISSLTTVYAGLKTGELERRVIKPVKKMWQVLNDPILPSITPYPTLISASPTPSPSLAPTIPLQRTVIQNNNSQPVSNCIQMNIREGEFSSNKCYASKDYEDLQYYLGRYRSAQFDLRAAEGGMKITCNCRVEQECAFFKDSCEEDRQQKSQAEADIANYRGIIQGIIAKGL